MSPQAKMGVVAAGLVLGLATGCGVVANSDVAFICNHGWWKTRPTADQVNGWADTLVSLNANDAIYIDENGKSYVFKQASGIRSNPRGGQPNGLSTRLLCVWLDDGVYKQRLTREQALKAIRKELEAADWQGR